MWVFTTKSDDGTLVVYKTESNSIEDGKISLRASLDGERWYTMNRTFDELLKCASESGKYDPEHWKQVLDHVLFGKYNGSPTHRKYRNLRVRTSTEDIEDDVIELVISELGSAGTEETLGSIDLELEEGQEKKDTVLSVVEHSARLNKSLAERVALIETRIADMQQHTDEIVREKEKFESQMITKFQLLLNSKKEEIARLKGETLGGVGASAKRSRDSIEEDQDDADDRLADDGAAEEADSPERNNESGGDESNIDDENEQREAELLDMGMETDDSQEEN